jgi:hypothetical protein
LTSNIVVFTIQSLLGIDCTVDSIRTKIKRVLDSYYKASDHLRETGGGLDGDAYNNYHDKIKNTVCCFYDELQPVLGDRPNVNAWFTNESTTYKGEENNKIDISAMSDDESFMSTAEDFNNNITSYRKVIDLNEEEFDTVTSKGTQMKMNSSLGVKTELLNDLGHMTDKGETTDTYSSKSSNTGTSKSKFINTSGQKYASLSSNDSSVDEDYEAIKSKVIIPSTPSPKRKSKSDDFSEHNKKNQRG